MYTYFPEPYTPYNVEISPVTQVVGQGDTTRQIVFTQEGGEDMEKAKNKKQNPDIIN